MKSKSEIITELNELLKDGAFERDEFEIFSKDLNNLSASDKEEVLLEYIKNVYSLDELISYYNRHPENLNNQISKAIKHFKDTTGYSDSEINDLFTKAGLTEENVKTLVEKDLDLDLLNIKEEAEKEGISLEEWLQNDTQRLENERDEELAEIDKQIEELERNNNNSERENLNEERVNNQEENNSTEKSYDTELLNKLFDEKITKLNNERYSLGLDRNQTYDIEKHHELSRKITKYEEIKNNYTKNNVVVDKEGLLFSLFSEKISDLENELNDLKVSNAKNLTPEIISQQKELTNKIEQYKKLVLLIKNEETKDTKKTVEENKEINNTNSDEIEKLKNDRKKAKRKYDTLIAKRKKQLKKLKKQRKRGHKKGNRKDLAIKSLAGLAGFAVGLGLSSVPGVGQVRMTLATAKLVHSGVKVWTKKHPEGKIAKISSKLSDKAQKFGENHSRIASAYSKMKKTIGNDKVQWFVNGVSAGYITGNIIEMTTGKTVGEHLFSNDNTKDVASVAKGTTQPTTPDTSVTPDVPSNTPTDINVAPGQNYDLSGLSQGLVSADSQNYVDILGQYSKDAIVDKFHTLPNGEVMVHFKNALDGQGIAWYKLADIEEYLKNGAEVVENVSRSL